MDPEFFAVNITCSFNHCHLTTFLADIQSESCDLIIMQFCGLIMARYYQDFFAFQNEIDIFLHEKSRPLAVITNSE